MTNYSLPPRQKMINLVYIILIAMLAINISADTLDTYRLLNREQTSLDDILERSVEELSDSAASACHSVKPAVADSMAAELLTFIDDTKEMIARAADRKKYTSAHELRNAEDLHAVPDVMLSSIDPRGTRLRTSFSALEDSLTGWISDSLSKELISSYLDLGKDRKLTSWEKATFTSMPAIGGITYLNTLKNNVRYAQLEFLKAMLSPEIPADAADRDMRYVLINEGQMIVEADGTVERPLVDIRPHIESALYEDYDNRIEILVIGIAPSGIDFSVSGASYRFSDGSLYIHPQKGVQEVSVRMKCMKDGTEKNLGEKRFIVRQLPEPMPYICFSDGTTYKGNVPVGKSRLLSMEYVGAGVSALPDIRYEVTGFETVLIRKGADEVLSAASDGSRFSDSQRALLASAEIGDKIYFTDINARIPGSGTEYQLPSINTPVY